MNTCLWNILCSCFLHLYHFCFDKKYFERVIHNYEDHSIFSHYFMMDSLCQNWAYPLGREEIVIRKSITYSFVTQQPFILNTNHLFIWIKMIVSLESMAQASNDDHLECQNVLNVFRRHLWSLIICLFLDIKSKCSHLTWWNKIITFTTQP